MKEIFDTSRMLLTELNHLIADLKIFQKQTLRRYLRSTLRRNYSSVICWKWSSTEMTLMLMSNLITFCSYWKLFGNKWKPFKKITLLPRRFVNKCKRKPKNDAKSVIPSITKRSALSQSIAVSRSKNKRKKLRMKGSISKDKRNLSKTVQISFLLTTN
jgi:hypothetical protein